MVDGIIDQKPQTSDEMARWRIEQRPALDVVESMSLLKRPLIVAGDLCSDRLLPSGELRGEVALYHVTSAGIIPSEKSGERQRAGFITGEPERTVGEPNLSPTTRIYPKLRDVD